MSIVIGTNTQLLHMLGITQKHVIEADIRLRQDEIATVTLTCAADVDSDQLTTARFTLWPLDPTPAQQPTPPFDLDTMCAAARERLAESTTHNAEWQLYEWRAESDAIHVRMNRAVRLHKVAVVNALSRLEPIGQLAYDLGAAKAEALEVLIEADAAVNGLHDLRSALRERFAREYQGGI